MKLIAFGVWALAMVLSLPGCRQTTAATHFRLCKSNWQGGQAAFFLANRALIEATSARGVAANRVLV